MKCSMFGIFCENEATGSGLASDLCDECKSHAIIIPRVGDEKE